MPLRPPEKTMQLLPSPEGVSGSRVAVAGAYAERAPLRRAVLAQCGALLLALTMAALAPESALRHSDAMVWAALQGGLAALLGRAMGMDIWWLPMHALFVPGLVCLLGLELSPLYALGAFFVLVSVYWGGAGNRVPLYLSGQAAARALADLLPPRGSFSFVDLGCGLGGVLGHLAKARPAGRFSGVESAPLPFLLSLLRTMLIRKACQVRWGDLRAVDLGTFDFVYVYLSPAVMAGLWEKATREMRPGSVLISNSFSVPGVPPNATVAAGGNTLLIWRL